MVACCASVMMLLTDHQQLWMRPTIVSPASVPHWGGPHVSCERAGRFLPLTLRGLCVVLVLAFAYNALSQVQPNRSVVVPGVTWRVCVLAL